MRPLPSCARPVCRPWCNRFPERGDVAAMTVFDYLVVGILVVSLLLGAWRGLVSEILALAAWALAFLAARHFGPLLVPWLAGMVSQPVLRLVLAYALVFVLTLIVLGLLRLLLRELLHAVGLGLADRTLGAIFGLLRGVLICLLLVLVGGLTDLPREPWWRGARLAPPLETAVLAASPWMPKAVSERLHYR